MSISVAVAVVLGAALSSADPQPPTKIDFSKTQPPKPPSSVSRIPADPPPMLERAQWVFDLRWDANEPYLVAVNPLELPKAQETPRAMGRFAIELYEGPALIERVRFDFPGLGAGLPDPKDKKAVALERKMKTRIGVVFPATKRGTKLELWDRATDRRWSLPWPVSTPRAAASGGK